MQKNQALKTQVAIIGAGPSGLMLGQMLTKAGIDNVILEKQTPEYVLGRIRAGVLEPSTIELLDDIGIGERMHKEGLVHQGFSILFADKHHRIDLNHLTQGRHVMVYGQTEITRDLMQAREQAEGATFYQVSDMTIENFAGDHPLISFTKDGKQQVMACDFIAGCDGFHGVCRATVVGKHLHEYEKMYQFGWIGLLCDAPPVHEELIYVHHPRGFALCSQRSRSRSRYYLQIPISDSLEYWTDERFWQELRLRLDESTNEKLITSASIEKSVAQLRSYVGEPMRFGRMFLAGDAAHIVPPTGAKGLNLAASDVRFLGQALIEHYCEHSSIGLDTYSERCLRRVWHAERFSWWFTRLTHCFPGDSDFDNQLQRADLDYFLHSWAGQQMIAENYIGLPLEWKEAF